VQVAENGHRLLVVEFEKRLLEIGRSIRPRRNTHHHSGTTNEPAKGNKGFEPTTRLTVLGVLRQRDYRLLLLGLAVSDIGTVMLYTTLPFYIFVRTGSTLATGAMLIAQMLPRILVGSIAGVLVDRWRARPTMIAGDLLRAAILLPLLAVQSRGTLGIVYAVAVAEGCVHQFFGSSFNASLPRLVGSENLPAANAINHISNGVERLIAPVTGGALLLSVGLPAVVILDSASYLFSALMLTLISIPGAAVLNQGEVPVAGIKQEWLDGIRVATQKSAIRNLLLIFGLDSVASGMGSVLLVPFANGVLGANALQYGSMLSVRAVGGLFGGLTAGSLGRRVPARRLWSVANVAVGVVLLAQLAIRAIQPVTVLMVPSGLFANLGTVSERTLLMTGFPDRHRGRLFGVWESFTGILLVMGMAIASFLGNPVGVVPIYALAALLSVVTGVIAGRVLVHPSTGPIQE
jgi:MFS family permease